MYHWLNFLDKHNLVGHPHDLGDLKTIISASLQSTTKERKAWLRLLKVYYIRWWKTLQSLQRSYIYIYISILNKKTVVFINQQDWASVIGQFPHHPILHTSIQFFLFFFVSVSVRKREIGFQCRVQFASKLAHVVPMCLKCARDLHEFCSNSEGPIRWNLLTCVSRENLDPHLSSIIYHLCSSTPKQIDNTLLPLYSSSTRHVSTSNLLSCTALKPKDFSN